MRKESSLYPFSPSLWEELAQDFIGVEGYHCFLQNIENGHYRSWGFYPQLQLDNLGCNTLLLVLTGVLASSHPPPPPVRGAPRSSHGIFSFSTSRIVSRHHTLTLHTIHIRTPNDTFSRSKAGSSVTHRAKFQPQKRDSQVLILPLTLLYSVLLYYMLLSHNLAYLFH